MLHRLRALTPLLSRAAAVALLLAVLEIVALAARPAWHELAHHHDADESGAECAVTLFATGAWHEAAPVPIVVPVLQMLPDEVVVERQRMVGSFRFSGVLEHAPPRRA